MQPLELFALKQLIARIAQQQEIAEMKAQYLRVETNSLEVDGDQNDEIIHFDATALAFKLSIEWLKEAVVAFEALHE